MKRLWTALLLLFIVGMPAMAQRAENALTWGFTSEIETLDPYATSKRTSQLVIRNVIETLMFRDAVSGRAEPLLAKSARWVDERTLEFALRDDVKFHDGQAF